MCFFNNEKVIQECRNVLLLFIDNKIVKIIYQVDLITKITKFFLLAFMARLFYNNSYE